MFWVGIWSQTRWGVPLGTPFTGCMTWESYLPSLGQLVSSCITGGTILPTFTVLLGELNMALFTERTLSIMPGTQTMLRYLINNFSKNIYGIHVKVTWSLF